MTNHYEIIERNRKMDDGVFAVLRVSDPPLSTDMFVDEALLAIVKDEKVLFQHEADIAMKSLKEGTFVHSWGFRD